MRVFCMVCQLGLVVLRICWGGEMMVWIVDMDLPAAIFFSDGRRCLHEFSALRHWWLFMTVSS